MNTGIGQPLGYNLRLFPEAVTFMWFKNIRAYRLTSPFDLSAEQLGEQLAQRGFQASARVVTTSDEVLQELLNIKR